MLQSVMKENCMQCRSDSRQKFDADDNTTSVLSSIENKAYRVQQKVKKEQLDVMYMWKKLHY
jgi:hypothetical protein